MAKWRSLIRRSSCSEKGFMAPTPVLKRRRKRRKKQQKKTKDAILAGWKVGGDDTGIIDVDEPSMRKPVQNCYFNLTQADVRQRQQQDIARLSDVLAIPRPRACDLLRRYKWRVSVAEESWFGEEELAVRDVVGADEEEELAAKLRCGICFEKCRRGDMTSASASCRHCFCRDCWRGYIRTAIADGLCCLTLVCPEPSCKVLVGQELIDELATAEEKARYARYLLQSYVQHSSTIKWCPSPGCEFAVEYDDDGGDGGYEVRCRCSHGFCWHCTEEVHRPVDCETVTKWCGKNMVEQQNTMWILTYTKPCPKCKRPIEKNKGCNHMTCTEPCKYEFCWFCLDKWPGYSHACNKYQAGDAKKEESKQVADAKRYMHYFERWDANQRSKAQALRDLSDMHNGRLAELKKRTSLTDMYLEFITVAWLQIADCRRTLKWSYAYGYFVPEHEKNKLELFECLQGMAESTVERLQGCAEHELDLFLAPQAPLEGFGEFKTKLVHLTAIARNHFKRLTRAMEEGLKDAAAAPESELHNNEGGRAPRGEKRRSRKRKLALRS